MDILSASQSDNSISWYENDGFNDTFTKYVISDATLGARSVRAIDVDGDGDVDALSASYEDDTVQWYEASYDMLKSKPSFIAHTITDSASSAYSVFAVDLEGDGDVDVLSASLNDDTVRFFGGRFSGNPSLGNA